MWLFEDGNQFDTLGDEKCYEDDVSMMCGGGTWWRGYSYRDNLSSPPLRL